MPRPFTASELVAADLVWLLDLTWGGQVYRFGSRSLTVTNEDGQALRYSGGLGDLGVDLAFGLLDETPGELSIPVSLMFPAGVDVAARVEGGHDLSRATAELSLHIVGNTYEDRRSILTGSLSEPEYGATGEPVSATIADLPYDDAALFPPANARISPDAWTALPNDQNDDQCYPFVFGEPGQYTKSDGSAASTRGSPAYVVEKPAGSSLVILIAGHHVIAPTVTIRNATAKTTTALSVVNSNDDAGNNTAAVVGLVSALGSDADTFFTNWTHGGAARSEEAAATLTKGGDLLSYFLNRSSIAVDRGRVKAASDYLNRYKFAGYLNDQVSPFEWLQDNLIPLLPISIASGPDGVYPIVWRFDARAGDALAHLVAGEDVHRESRVTYLNRDIINELRLSFAWEPERQKHMRTITVNGEPHSATTSDVITNGYAKISRDRFGARASEISTDIVYDQTTAAAILDWKIRAGAFPSRAITYTAPASMAWLQRGDVVTLTDSDLSLSSQVALVQSVSIRLSSLSVTLLINEDPFREL